MQDLNENSYIDSNQARNSNQSNNGISDMRNSISNLSQNSNIMGQMKNLNQKTNGLNSSQQQTTIFFGAMSNQQFDPSTPLYNINHENAIYDQNHLEDMNLGAFCSPNPYCSFNHSINFQQISTATTQNTSANQVSLNQNSQNKDLLPLPQKNQFQHQSQQNQSSTYNLCNLNPCNCHQSTQNEGVQLPNISQTILYSQEKQETHNPLPPFHSLQKHNQYRDQQQIYQYAMTNANHNSGGNQASNQQQNIVAALDLIMQHGQHEEMLQESRNHSSQKSNQRDSAFQQINSIFKNRNYGQEFQQEVSENSQNGNQQYQEDITKKILFEGNYKQDKRINYQGNSELLPIKLPKIDQENFTQQCQQQNTSAQQLSSPFYKKTDVQKNQLKNIVQDPSKKQSKNKSFYNLIQIAQQQQHISNENMDFDYRELLPPEAQPKLESLNSNKQMSFQLSPQPHLLQMSPSEFNHHYIDDQHQPRLSSKVSTETNFNNILVANYAKLKRDSQNAELTFAQQQQQQTFHQIHHNHKIDNNNNGSQRSSRESQYNFCNSCHYEYFRRLDEDEQKKRKELEAIQREKDYIRQRLQNDSYQYNSQQNQQQLQQQEMLFYCNRIDNPGQQRKIGKLSLQERYKKVKKFKEKKQRRIWKKKIFYDCRKQVADKRLRIKGRFIRKEDQKKLLQQIFGNGELFPQDVTQFNSTLTQLMSEYHKQKMEKNKIKSHDFIIEQKDEKGNRHRFFDFQKFNNFIEEEEEEESVPKANNDFSQEREQIQENGQLEDNNHNEEINCGITEPLNDKVEEDEEEKIQQSPKKKQKNYQEISKQIDKKIIKKVKVQIKNKKQQHK